MRNFKFTTIDATPKIQTKKHHKHTPQKNNTKKALLSPQHRNTSPHATTLSACPSHYWMHYLSLLYLLPSRQGLVTSKKRCAGPATSDEFKLNVQGISTTSGHEPRPDARAACRSRKSRASDQYGSVPASAGPSALRLHRGLKMLRTPRSCPSGRYARSRRRE